MKNTYCLEVHPANLSEEQKNELVLLHQKYITLTRHAILEHLKNRDFMYLYYHKDTHRLIATAGVQYIKYKNHVFIYIGNTVVDKEFCHESCTAHTILCSMIYAYLHFPFKKKHWCALTSSPGSFSYSQRYQPCWPNQNSLTPPEITSLMIECLKQIGIDKYKIVNGNIIADSLCDKIKQNFHKTNSSTVSAKQSQPSHCTSNASYFHQINPGAEKGEQLFFINSMRIYKLINAGIYSLHSRLIIQPKHYHRLKKCRNRNSIWSGLLFINSLISKRIKLLCITTLVTSWIGYLFFM